MPLDRLVGAEGAFDSLNAASCFLVISSAHDLIAELSQFRFRLVCSYMQVQTLCNGDSI